MTLVSYTVSIAKEGTYGTSRNTIARLNAADV